jgi:hypothetical protein
MKCQSCGAIGSPGKANCEFCGAAFVLMQAGSAPAARPAAPTPQGVPQAAPSPSSATSSNNNDAPPSEKETIRSNRLVAPQISFVQDTLNLISELHATPSSGFKIWAFIFPVAYLYGYGAKDNAKKVASTSLIPQFILGIVAYLSYKLAGVLDVAAAIWFFYVCYLVSTRTHALVVKDATYNMSAGIIAQVMYTIAFLLISLL